MNDYAPECMRVSFAAKTTHDGQNLLITANLRDTERDPTGNIMLPGEGAKNGERERILIRVREALSNERSEAVVLNSFFEFKKRTRCRRRIDL